MEDTMTAEVTKIALFIVLFLFSLLALGIWLYKREFQQLLKRRTKPVRVTIGVNDQPPPYPGRGSTECGVSTITGGLMSYQQATENDTLPSYDSIPPQYHPKLGFGEFIV